MEDIGTFYGHLVYIPMLWSLCIFYGNSVYFMVIWYILW
jgi:hypothetical protein